MVKAYSYIRFSTTEQAKGDSLRRQLKLSDDYAAKHGLQLDTSLRLRDLGMSGFTGENVSKGALGAFLRAVESGMVKPGSILLVESLDRLSRADVLAQLNLFIGLISAGIEIVTLTDGMHYSKESIKSSINGLMYSLMVMSRGHEESSMKSKRLKAAWEGKRATAKDKALTAQCPAWLRMKADRSGYEKIPERCALVKRIFQMVADGIGKDLIARTFNREGIETWGRGKGWHASYVQKILQSRTVIGEYEPHMYVGGKRVPACPPLPDYYPAAIPAALFQQIASKRANNARSLGRKSEKVSNLFSGLTKCGYTGDSFVYIDKGEQQYLVSSAARRGLGGVYASWPYAHFETAFLTFLSELNFGELFDEQWRAKFSVATETLRQQETKLETVKVQLARYVDALGDSDAQPKAILAKVATLETEQEQLEEGIAKLKKDHDAAEQEAKQAINSQDSFKTLMEKRNDTTTRFKLQQHIREHVEKIEIFAKGLNESDDALEQQMFRTFNDKVANVKRKRGPSVKFKIRAFKVIFKTGAIRLVATPHERPDTLLRSIWCSDQTKGEFTFESYSEDGAKLRFTT